jgi:uncharacterized protein YegP (UPF0339 family)
MFINKSSVRRFALIVALSVPAVACGGAPEEAADGQTTEAEAELTARNARFETFVGFDGQYYFELIAGNGKNVLRSEGYVSNYNAKRGIDALLNDGVDASAYEVKQAHNGDYYFNVVAGNGEIISSSELYSTKSNAQRGARSARSLVAALTDPPTTAAPTNPRFELFHSTDGKTHFRLRAGNGEIVLASQGYSSKASAQNGIASVKENGAYAERFDRIEGEDGEVRIRLVANNGAVIANGEAYVSGSNADRAITRISDLLTRNIPTTEQ